MRKGIKNNILILFFLILFAVPVYWIVQTPVSEKYSYIEARYLNNIPEFPHPRLRTVVKRLIQGRLRSATKILLGDFLSQTFQNNFQSAVSDQFPLRMEIIQTAKAIDREVIELVYAPLNDPAIPTDMHSIYYVTRDGNRILHIPEKYNSSIEHAIDNRIKNYGWLISHYPNLNFYLFCNQTLENSQYDPLNMYFFDADRGRGLQYFIDHKPVGLSVSVMPMNSYEEHALEYYRTDHHMNLVGLAQAYNGVYDLLANNYSNISPRLNLESIFTFEGAKFLGSLSRRSFYPIEGDEFQVFILGLPEYKVYSRGKEFFYKENMDGLQNDYIKTPYFDYYGEYYDLQNAIYEFDFENGSTRNLVIFGSSYSRPIVRMIASHYDHTYYVDMRQQNSFSFDQFLAEHPVDDVLFFGDNLAAFIDGTWIVKQ